GKDSRCGTHPSAARPAPIALDLAKRQPQRVKGPAAFRSSSLGVWWHAYVAKGERDERVAQLLFGDLGVAAGGDDDVLTARRPDAIRHRRRVPARRQLALPQLAPGFHVERAQVRIDSAGDEHETARCHDGPSEADGS